MPSGNGVAVGVASVTDVAVGADVGVGAAVAVGVASVTDVAVEEAPALQAAATARPHVTRVSPSRHILRELLSAFIAQPPLALVQFLQPTL